MKVGEFIRRIESRECRVGVVGLGYVGLPLAVLFAKRGYSVLGGDVKEEVVRSINFGKCPINERGVAEILAGAVSKKLISATTSVGGVVRDSDAIFIVVQTPIDENRNPDLTALESVCRTIGQNLRGGELVVVESTVPPGAAMGTIVPLLESSGLIAGRDFYLAYSPERAMPTRTLEEIQTNSRIVGGINKESAELAKELYRKITTGEIILEDIPTVEVVKIIENTYRDVNIALANEIAVLCERLGVDAVRAIKIANKHPRVNIHMPGSGVGGHCIPKDPHFLISRARELGIELKLISSAREVNDNMPKHVLELVENALKSVNKSVKDSKVAVLGITYKGDTDDIRGTPSKEIITSLIKANCDVFSHDPYVSSDFGGKFSNDIVEAVKDSDCVVIVTDHSTYKKINPADLAKHMKRPGVIVDGRRVLNPGDVKDKGISYFGVGY